MFDDNAVEELRDIIEMAYSVNPAQTEYLVHKMIRSFSKLRRQGHHLETDDLLRLLSRLRIG